MAVIRARTAGARTLPPAARLTQADLDVVPVTEAIARVTRVVAAAGSKYAALVSVIGTDYADDMAQRIQVMIQELLRRGIDDGTFRGDLAQVAATRTPNDLVALTGELGPPAVIVGPHERAWNARRGVAGAALLSDADQP